MLVHLNPHYLKKHFREFDKRRAALTWRPIGIVFTVLSALGGSWDFIRSSGEFSIPAFGLLAISLAIFMSVPVPSIRSFVLRAVSLLMDMLILTVVTVVGAFILTATGIYRESSISLAVITWLWLAYYVICDYLYGRTLGKRILGLRLISLRPGRPSLITCLLRTLFLIPVPLIAASYASHSLDLLHSRLSFSLAMFLRATVVCLLPASMLFYGRDQGLVDLVFKTAVRRNSQHSGVAPDRSVLAGTVLTVLVALGFGCAQAGVAYIFAPTLLHEALPTPSGTGMTSYRMQSSPEIERMISAGFRDPSTVIAGVEFYRFTGHQPVLAQKPDLLVLPGLAQEYAKASEVPLLRVILFPPTSSMAKAMVLENAARALQSSIQSNDKPAFAVVQLSSFLHAGPLRFQSNESFLFCSFLSGTDRVSFYADLRRPRSVDMKWSLDFFRWVFLFDRKFIDAFRPYV